MLHHATIYINPVGVAEVGFAQAAGMPGDFRFDFKHPSGIAWPDIVHSYPQLVLRPHTRGGSYAYDIVIDDPTGSSGLAQVPGSVMNDRFNVEVYSRYPAGTQPYRMLAVGRVDLTGYAYTSSSPLSPATYAQGPSGPAGPTGATGAAGAAGAPGVRGSRWYTGVGSPSIGVPDSRVDGDMWLDESTGDVYRWSAAMATWSRFTGN